MGSSCLSSGGVIPAVFTNAACLPGAPFALPTVGNFDAAAAAFNSSAASALPAFLAFATMSCSSSCNATFAIFFQQGASAFSASSLLTTSSTSGSVHLLIDSALLQMISIMRFFSAASASGKRPLTNAFAKSNFTILPFFPVPFFSVLMSRAPQICFS